MTRPSTAPATTNPPAVEQLEDRLVPTNILLVMLDDARWDAVERHMPQTAAWFAAHGRSFRNAYVQNPVCGPSRVSTLTGLTTLHHGFASNDGMRWQDVDHANSLPVLLDQEGYQTALFGKYINGYRSSRVPPGWDRFDGFSGRAGYYDYTMTLDGTLRHYGSSPRAYSTDVIRRRAAGYLNQIDSGRPWFTMVTPFAPHGPATPAGRHASLPVKIGPRSPAYNEADVGDKPGWLRRHDRLSATKEQSILQNAIDVARSLAAADQLFMRLVRVIENRGMLQDTVVFLTSDNGYLRGEHRLTAKTYAYEESLRSPFYVAQGWGGAVGTDATTLVSTMDLMPTILSYAGATIPRVDGKDLSVWIHDEGITPGPREHLIIENFDPKTGPAWQGVHGPDWVYVDYATGLDEWYDLATDPHQLTNRINDPTQQARIDDAAFILLSYRNEYHEW